MHEVFSSSNSLISLVCHSLQKTLVNSFLLVEFQINVLYCFTFLSGIKSREIKACFSLHLYISTSSTKQLRSTLNTASISLLCFKSARIQILISQCQRMFCIKQPPYNNNIHSINNRGSIRTIIMDVTPIFSNSIENAALLAFLSILSLVERDQSLDLIHT